MLTRGYLFFEDGKTVFKDTPENMAAQVKELIDAGANIIGGCCGTNPAHISAMAGAAEGGCGRSSCCCQARTAKR